MSAAATAVILAAGRGVRLAPRTEHQPKPLTPVNGTSIIDNLLSALDSAGVQDVVIVTGHLAESLERHAREHVGRCRLHFVHNERFATTNNIFSLWLAREFFGEGLLLFEADVFFERGLVHAMIENQHENVAVVDRFRAPMNGTVVERGPDGFASTMHLGKEQAELDLTRFHKTVNFYRFDGQYAREILLPGLEQHVSSGELNSYYELVIKESIDQGSGRLHCLETGPHRWWEIDTEDDLRIAEAMFQR